MHHHPPIQSICRDIQQFSQLQTRTGTREEEYSREVSTSKWYNPFSWGSTRTVYYTRTHSYEYFAATDAAIQVNQYAQDCAFQIEQTFGKMLVDTLQTASAHFDPQAFRNLIDRELRQLDLPALHLNIDNAAATISKHFQGEVTGSSMEKLQQILNQSLHEVFSRLDKDFIQAVDGLLGHLQQTRNSLHDQLTVRIREDLAQTRQEFSDKVAHVESYQALLAATHGLQPLFK